MTSSLGKIAAVLLGSAGVLGCGAGVASASNVINNPGFETAPTTPVTPNDWQYSGSALRDSTNPYSGSFEANLNNTTEATNSSVFQQTAFGSVTGGTSYTLSFYSEFQGANGGIAQAQFEFMNSAGGILPGSPSFISLPTTTSNFGVPAGYALTSQNFTAPTGASAVFLAFNAITGAVTGSVSHAYVDNVSLAAVSTPEPASFAVLAIGAVSLLALRRRRVLSAGAR